MTKVILTVYGEEFTKLHGVTSIHTSIYSNTMAYSIILNVLSEQVEGKGRQREAVFTPLLNVNVSDFNMTQLQMTQDKL